MSDWRLRIVSAVGGVAVSAIAFLVSTRILDVALEVPAGPGGGDAALTLPRIIAVTLIAVLIGLVAAVVVERRSRRPQRSWLVFSCVGLLLSFLPTALLVDDLGTKVILAIIHLGVATVVIPIVASTLPESASA